MYFDILLPRIYVTQFLLYGSPFGFQLSSAIRHHFVIKTKTEKKKTKLKGKIHIPAQTSINLLLFDSYRLDILSYLSGNIWHLALS